MIYDMKCSECEKEQIDWWCSSSELEEQKCPECGGKLNVKISAVKMQMGQSWHQSGDLNRFEVVHTDLDGKRTVIDLKHKVKI